MADRRRRIEILPDAVANQIAAGEVVERPASVVKELAENALDAGARRIEIGIERGGKRRIRVSDDGVGMVREDALLCLDRHATSKIRSAADLRGVRTFGFRGEALPSIAAVSDLTIETRNRGDEVGTSVRVKGGGILSVDDVARRPGTTMDVLNLFFNAPARAKFLKAVAAETRAIAEAVTVLALANPKVRITLLSEGRPLIDLAADEALVERIAALWPDAQPETLVQVRGGGRGVEVTGWVQRPDRAHPGLRRAYLLVNGRPVKEPRLVRAVDRAYRTTISEQARPWLFLSLSLPGGEVDVNVHPTKAEVRFREIGQVEAAVEDAVRAALATGESAARLGVPGAPALVRERGPGDEADRGKDPPSVGAGSDAQMALFVSASSPGSLEGDGAAESESSMAAPFLHVQGRPRLWQVLDTYVLAETPDGLLIIDQHSAHERILFERLMAAYGRGGETGQRLLFPLTFRLTTTELARVEELGGLLARAGFEVEAFGGDTVIVHSVPNPHPYFDAERCFREMIAELTEGSDLVRSAANQHERIAKTFACKGSIKAGQTLRAREMEELFDQLFATELPHHDVHGRPTIVRLSGRELERRFGR